MTPGTIGSHRWKLCTCARKRVRRRQRGAPQPGSGSAHRISNSGGEGLAGYVGEGQMGIKGGRTMKRLIAWCMLSALLIVLGLVGVAAAQQPRYGGTLRVAWESEMTGFDPHWSPGL